ncbi:hypothetical protein C8A00DRAFT_17773 [Chaetomidium leptoderma]|uniref:Uncharacterized protein n=1 Tax=Chaetomidium leptoderma TaxID=669021 RepID=A0AAN6VFX7_9PEZI|nr:hypothetical protein C8A00DRAFT_17773 [Chaetomidium leptoderma]
MHHTALLPLFSSILLLGGLAAAVPVATVEEKCESQTICVDSINPCGIRYGGCYDVCDLSAKPIAPPCPMTTITTPPPIPTTKKTTTKKPAPTTTKKVTTKEPAPTNTKKATSTKPPPSSTTSKCSNTVSVCWDGINECGMMYGGYPWPTFVPPPCPTKASMTKVITAVTTLPVLTKSYS